MAEARIHLLLDTVVRAQTQLDEQKHYCFASLDTLVKLLPVGKGNGRRRKGFRVFNAPGLQGSSRDLQTCSVRASPRAPQVSQAVEARTQVAELDEVVRASPRASQAVQAGTQLVRDFSGHSSKRTQPRIATSPQGCQSPGSRDEVVRASPRASQAALAATQLVRDFSGHSSKRTQPRTATSPQGFQPPGNRDEVVRACPPASQAVQAGIPVAEQDFSGHSSRRTQPPTATPQGCVSRDVDNIFEGEAPTDRASSGKCRASGSPELEAVHSGAVQQICVGDAVQNSSGHSSRRTRPPTATSPQGCGSQDEDNLFEGEAPKDRASSGKCRASGSPELEAVQAGAVQQTYVGDAVQDFSGHPSRGTRPPRATSPQGRDEDNLFEGGAPKDRASSGKCKASGSLELESVQSGAPQPVQRASSMDQDQVLQHFCEGEAVSPASKRKRQASRNSEGIPLEAPGPLASRGQQSEPGGSSKSNLVASVRSFLPLIVQQPAVPIANGKKDVRVKALEAADAARRLEEKRLEERKRKFESLKRDKFPDQKARLDQEKQKKFEEEQRKKDEERKKKELEVNAKKRKKDEVEKKEREEKRRKVEDAMRLKKDQEEKLRAEREGKEQRRKAMEEAERERKALEEEMKRQKRAEKEREIERRRKAEEDAKAAWLASKEAERKRREETFQRMKVLEKEQRSHGASVLGTSELPIRGTSLNFAKQSLVLEKEQQRSHGAGGFGTSELPARGTSLNLAKKSLGLDGAGEKFVGTPALRIRSCGGSRLVPVVPISDLEESDEDEPTSYEISPYKSSSEDEGEGHKQRKVKIVPSWARKEKLMLHLMRQVHIDPDAIFSGAKSCSLNEVFGTTGNKKRRDFSQRSGSGDWLADLVTWKEELEYKKTMGYLQPRAG